MRFGRLLIGMAIVGGVTVSAQARQSPATEPSGASAAFTTADPVVVAARHLVEQGKFAEAEKTLRETAGPAKAEAAEMLDIIARIRIAYAMDAGALLDRLRPSIPDVSGDDLERWRTAGQVQFRMIDGRVAYFAREPANIFRFCEDAKRRRKSVPAPAAWKLEDHLAGVIAAAQREHKALIDPVHRRARYTLTIDPEAPGLKRGALVRVWLPFPRSHERQTDVKLISTSPPHQVLAPETAPQRTIYFEQRAGDKPGPVAFDEVFEFTSSADYPELNDASARPLPPEWSGGNLGERPPHILFSPQLRQAVARVVEHETNPLARARRIFHFVARDIAYCAEEEYGTIPSLSEKALRSRRGDCGVQAMLFIAMCRCAGIPARWQSGWQTRPDNGPDMHDWAEFYVAPWGWLPADPSYGLCDSADPRVREFYFGHQDSYRLIVNADYGSPLVPPKESLRSEPLDFQRGEVEIDGRNLYFPFWDYAMRIERLDEGDRR